MGILGAMTVSQKPKFVIELERLFATFNCELFEGRLKLPTISVHPEKQIDFQFVPATYQLLVGNKIAEFNLNEILEAFLHAMVHIEVAAKRNYHSKKFLAAALEVGFYVTYTDGHGWDKTTFEAPRNPLLRIMFPGGNERNRLQEVVSKIRVNESALYEMQQDMKNRKVKPFLLKYECGCPPPHNSIRSGRRPDGANPINIRCCTCNQLFRCVEG